MTGRTWVGFARARVEVERRDSGSATFTLSREWCGKRGS
jgi:hypothetical protein